MPTKFSCPPRQRALAVGLPLHVVHGNNLGDMVRMHRMAQESNGALVYYGGDASIELAGRRLFMTHYPHLARGIRHCTRNAVGCHTAAAWPGKRAGLGIALH